MILTAYCGGCSMNEVCVGERVPVGECLQARSLQPFLLPAAPPTPRLATAAAAGPL